MKLTKEQIDALNDACFDESTKVIRYLEEEKELRKRHDLFMTIVTVIGAIGSIIAAITGIIVLLQ